MIRCPLPIENLDHCDGFGSPSCRKVYRHNLRVYWRQHVVHVLLGALAGALLVALPVTGIGFLAALCFYQGIEFAKRHDTPGIDMAYIIGGTVLGILPTLGVLYA